MLNHKGFYSVTIEKTIEPNSTLPLINPVQDPNQVKGDVLNTSADVYKVMIFLEKADREILYALHLDVKNRLIAMELVSMGNLTSSLIHPREVFKGAILNNSASVILVHNHPSGDPAPSAEDMLITEKLRQAGEILGIPLLDHIIIGDKQRHYSFLEGGRFMAAGIKVASERPGVVTAAAEVASKPSGKTTGAPITDDERNIMFGDLLLVHAAMDAVYATFAAQNLTLMSDESIVALLGEGMRRVDAIQNIVDRY